MLWDTVEDLTALDSHIAFATQMVCSYASENHELQKRLRDITYKQRDKNLNISVIGEFSSGKSSFINALLGVDLLVSSTIQGTTVAITVIEYFDSYCLYVEHTDGTSPTIFNPSTLEELRALVSHYTTNPDTPDNIGMIHVGLPSQTLAKGIRIIDTPGTNSNNRWHEEVTRRALRDLSDLSIVLTDGTRPMPETLKSFMDQTIADIYAQCVMVVTRMDMVPARERADVLDYVGRSLVDLTGGIEMPVLPYCSMAVQSLRIGGGDLDSKQARMASLSLESEQQIMHHTASQRRVAQIKKLIALTSHLYTLLESDLSTRCQDTRSHLDFLRKSRTTPLTPFINQQKKTLHGILDNKVMAARPKLVEELERKVEELNEKALDKIYGAKSIDDLKRIMNTEFSDHCSKLAKQLATVRGKYIRSLTTSFMSLERRFVKDFEKEFEKLDIVSIDFKGDGSKVRRNCTKKMDDNTTLTTLVNGESFMENAAFLGGAGAGAVIGTMLFPGVGTILGLFAGFLAGGWAAPSRDKVVAKTAAKAEPAVDEYFEQVSTDMLISYDEHCTEMEKMLDKMLKAYVATYHVEVDRLIKLQEHELDTLETRLTNMHTDVEQISQHRRQLTSLMRALDTDH